MKFVYKDKLTKEYKKADLSGVTGVRKLTLSVRKGVADAKKEKIKKVAYVLKDIPEIGLTESQIGELIAREALIADYEFTKYLSVPKEGWNFIAEVAIVGKASRELRKGVERGRVIAGEVNMTRELSNTPAGDMTPAVMAAAAREAVNGTTVSVKVLERKEMEKLGMGAVLAVGKGSEKEPCFIVMEYWGAASEKPIVLVGKGITFDTGGIQLKPSKGGYLHEMHMDMSGGAAVIYALAALAKLGVKKNIIALIPAAENMISGSSYRPGDIIKSMSGKTIEIGNTDAEGRLILADALTYAKRYEPALVVDVATLTGGAMVALGTQASAIFTADKNLQDKTMELAEATADYVWPLPLWDEFLPEVHSSFADINNAGKSHPIGAACVAAIFLKQFADFGKGKWMHIDMAPTMTPAEQDNLAKGAKGSPVKLLISLIENY